MAEREARLAETLLGVRTPGTLLLFVLSSVLSLSLIFHPRPESVAALTAYGWGSGPLFWEGELWRLWVNHLLHTRLLHFLFNAYWFLRLGPVLEEILGTRRFLWQTFLAAWAVGLVCNLTWEEGGIGLSGVICFQLGYLVILSGRHRCAAEVCDPATRKMLLVSLLLLGPALTLLGWVKVGNLAHISGCLAGMGAGWMHLRRETGRLFPRPAFSALLLLLLAGSWYLHAPQGNPSWHFWKAYNATEPQEQVRHYRAALDLDPANFDVRYNLGLLYFETGDNERAEELWLQCAEQDPESGEICQALFSLYARRGDPDGMERWASRLQRVAALPPSP